MAWILLFIAGLFEIVWAIALKLSDGFTKPLATGVTFVGAAISFWLLALAMKSIPAGTAYAVWTGIGAVGVALLGIVLFSEPATLARLAFIALIVVGIVGLKFVS